MDFFQALLLQLEYDLHGDVNIVYSGRLPWRRWQMSNQSKKRDRQFQLALQQSAILDRKTGNLRFSGLYASCYVNFGWNGGIVSVPHSHVVWFLTHKKWPPARMRVDHIDNDPMNNAPSNLQLLSEADNQKKRRGRAVYRNYGTGRYGYGLNVHADKRDGRFYVTRQMSRGHGNGDLRNVRISLGGYDTREDAEAKIKACIAEIELRGLDHVPSIDKRNAKKTSIALAAETKRIKALRREGKTMQQIADITGFSLTSIFNRTKNITRGGD